MPFDKNTKYTWLDDHKIRSEQSMRNELLVLIGFSFFVAVLLVIAFFMLIR